MCRGHSTWFSHFKRVLHPTHWAMGRTVSAHQDLHSSLGVRVLRDEDPAIFIWHDQRGKEPGAVWLVLFVVPQQALLIFILNSQENPKQHIKDIKWVPLLYNTLKEATPQPANRDRINNILCHLQHHLCSREFLGHPSKCSRPRFQSFQPYGF